MNLDFVLTPCMARHGECVADAGGAPPWPAAIDQRGFGGNAKGAFWYCTYEGALNAELFVELLQR